MQSDADAPLMVTDSPLIMIARYERRADRPMEACFADREQEMKCARPKFNARHDVGKAM